MIRPLGIALACALSVTLVAGCGGDDNEATGTSTLSASSEPATSTAPASTEVIDVNVSGSAPDFGHQWTVTKVVRNFPTPESKPLLKDSEIVLIQIKLTAGDKYYSGLYDSAFRLVDDNGDTATSMHRSIEAEMKAAGYGPVVTEAKHGETATGWIAFTVSEPGSKTLILRHEQDAAEVLNGGEKIAAKDIDITLVG